MSQSGSLQNDQKRLAELKKFTPYFNEEYKRYTALCEVEGVEPKPLFTDLSYYDNVDEITTEEVGEVIRKAFKELYIKAKKEDPEKRAKIDQTLAIQQKKTCKNCSGRRIMYLSAYSRDASSITFPSGIRYSGYFPYLPNLCGNDDASFYLCVDCGTIVGFDPVKFNKALFRAQYFGFEY